MQNLNKLIELLNDNEMDFTGDYFIPEVWNSFDYKDYKVKNREKEININPFRYYKHCIKNVILKNLNSENEYSEELKYKKFKKSVIYGLLPKKYSAWNHYNNEYVRGSILKMISLLPYLKKMNVNFIYLLPVFESSKVYKKGEVGSPYAIKDLYKLDKELHDDLLGDYSKELLDVEFKAFIEAAHLMGIKIMIDFVFRTVSRDNNLIISNPEWFYWIKLEKQNLFKVPKVKSLKKAHSINKELVKNLYENENTINKYIDNFSYAPNVIDRNKWNSVLKEYEINDNNILEEIEEKFNITTTPGFSDVLNDEQPFWTDVTYLRFYKDVSNISKKYYSKTDNPPYILQDSAKLNIFYGNDKNNELWDYILKVIPYYQKEFGIDGARIDMGHALPEELLKDILKEAYKINSDFVFWSEELSSQKSLEAKNYGFNFISGTLWATYKNFNSDNFNELLLKEIENSELPMISSPETPDTPRAVFYHENIDRYNIIIYLSMLLPKTLIYVNCGMEFKEIQPMNLGLDNSEEGKYLLDKSNKMFGKLAFFDNYIFDWLSDEKDEFINEFCIAFSLREKFHEYIDFESLNTDLLKSYGSKKITLLEYTLKNKKLIIIINRDLENSLELSFLEHLLSDVSYCKSVYSNKNNTKKVRYKLLPGEVLIYEILI